MNRTDSKCQRPALRYHGGKWRVAPWIISHFPTHKVYVEPFGGAAGVLLRKPRSYGEVYNDLDSDVVNFFKVFRDPKHRVHLIELVRCTPYARSEFKEAYQSCADPVERARRLLIRAEMGFGSAGATKGKTGFRSASLRHLERKNPSRNVQMIWKEIPTNLRKVADRFQGVTIENRTAIDVIRYWDRVETLFYVDPPYLPSVRVMSSGDRYYRHEMTAADHRGLLSQLLKLKGMVVLSGYASELYENVLAGWKRVERTCSAAGNRGSNKRTECLWLNPAVVDRLEVRGQMPLFQQKGDGGMLT